MEAFSGRDAATLRSKRFAMERDLARHSEEPGAHAVRRGRAWETHLDFLYRQTTSSSDNEANAKFFRLEALRGLASGACGIDWATLRAATVAAGRRLGLRVDASGPSEEEARGEPFGFLEKVFGAEDVGAMRSRLAELGRVEDDEEVDAILNRGSRGPGSLTPSPPSTSAPSSRSSPNHEQQRRQPNYLARKRLAPSTDSEQRLGYEAERRASKKPAPAPVLSRRVSPPSGAERDADGDDENEAPAGAVMFQSARQALCSNLSSPSKAKNYGHTMNQERRELGELRRHRPAGLMRKPPQQQGGAKGGFVPPYVKKALEATGHQAGGGGGGGGKGKPAGRRGAAAGRGPQAEEGEAPFSPKVMEMILERSPDGEVPEEISKLDPQLVESICNDIMENTGVCWTDIVGQGEAKQLVKEMVVWPMLNPNLFKGARSPPKGLLLFGPPGTGKTLIGKAIASNIKATFFSISASSLTSKWIGEGEKMVRTLFALAGYLQPAVIFIDEIDSILSARKSDGEHEASRRLKTEMLVQIEGCDPSSSERRVLIVGATNRPEELDEAARRRMPKQLYIPLPCEEARRAMVSKGIAEIRHALTQEDMAKIVSKTDGYSGSDMKNFIQEACQGPVRDVMLGRNQQEVENLNEADLRPMVIKDFVMASRAQKATVSPGEIQRYLEYNAKHGASYIREDEVEEEW